MKRALSNGNFFTSSWLRGSIVLLVLLTLGCARSTRVRFATFNASLNRATLGQLITDLSTGENQQARNVAEIIQRTHPDVLLINEFDYDAKGEAAKLFQKNYLSIAQNDCAPINYPYCVVLPSNTGMASGYDLDNDGTAQVIPGSREYGNDSIGFGEFPGQYAFVIYSKYAIDQKSIRTFQTALWKDLPAATLPKKDDGTNWYTDAELSVLRLSSKNHVNVPITIDGKIIHVLASHPTPPSFDGPEDRNGKRNRDEIRFWTTHLPRGPFVVMGDLNADPQDGGSIEGAVQQLLEHERIDSFRIPTSAGGVEAAREQAGANSKHLTPSAHDTADFGDDPGPGNLRCDYVLPSVDLRMVDGGVFWPRKADPLHRLVEMKPTASSDHRLVWLDLLVPQ